MLPLANARSLYLLSLDGSVFFCVTTKAETCFLQVRLRLGSHFFGTRARKFAEFGLKNYYGGDSCEKKIVWLGLRPGGAVRRADGNRDCGEH